MQQTFGAALRALRTDRGLSLRALGRRTHFSAGYLSQLESGARHAPPETAAALDRELAAGGRLVDLAAVGGWCPPVPDLAGDLWVGADAEVLADALVGASPTAESAVQLARLWLATPPPQAFQLAAGRRVGADLVGQVERRVHQIRLLDDHLGGRDSLTVATAELAATAALVRAASAPEPVMRRLLTAVADLCQIAGWINADAGRLPDARRIYLAGVRAGHAAGDPVSAASCLSSLAYATANDGEPAEAVAMAEAAVRGAARLAVPAARALLLERLAWAQARSGDTPATVRTLAEVDEAWAARSPGEVAPLWTYWLNPEEIEVMAGRCWVQLHRPLRAAPALEHAIGGYREDLARESALYLTWWAEALFQGGEVEQAAAVTGRAARLDDGASARVTQRLAVMGRLLNPCLGTPGVARDAGA